MARRLLLYQPMRTVMLSVLLLAACAGSPDDSTDGPGTGDDGGGDDDAPVDVSTCGAEYGDGVCQLSLACGIPDIDCFATYTSDEAARQWYMTEYFEAFSSDPGHAGAALPASDARVQRARQLTDRVWAKFPQAVNLGELGEKPLAVVVIDNASINAFAISTLDGKSSLSIQYLAGILDSMSDEALEGVVAHELGHVVGLHAFEDVYYGTQKYYAAQDGEPIGAMQSNSPAIQAQAEAWMTLARDVGNDRQAGLGIIPVGGMAGWYLRQLTDRVTAAGSSCSSQAYAVANGQYALTTALDDGYDLGSASWTAFKQAYTTFRTCFVNQATTFGDLKSYVLNQGYTEDQVPFGTVTDNDVFNLNALVALEKITQRRRGAMATIEQAFQNEQDAYWSQLRWYSTEEMADDFAVLYTRKAQMIQPGIAEATSVFLGDRTAACDAARTDDVVPYGVHLEDAHHGSCWRRDHAYRYNAFAATRAKKHAAPAWRAAFRPERPVSHKPMH